MVYVRRTVHGVHCTVYSVLRKCIQHNILCVQCTVCTIYLIRTSYVVRRQPLYGEHCVYCTSVLCHNTRMFNVQYVPGYNARYVPGYSVHDVQSHHYSCIRILIFTCINLYAVRREIYIT